MSAIQHLREQLRDTESAVERLDKLAAENPTDAVIAFNLRAIQKRKADLERRLRTELGPPKPGYPVSPVAEFAPNWGPAVQFGISENHRLAIGPRNGNDTKKLEQLFPLLRSLSGELIEMFDASNVPYEYLGKRARAYNALIMEDLDDIDFTRLFVEGVRLENAARVSEQSGLAVPDSHVRELIHSLLSIHFWFIDASAEGTALLEATIAHRYAEFAPLLQNTDALIGSEASSQFRNAFETVRSDTLEVAKEIRTLTEQFRYTVDEYGRQQNSRRLFAIGLIQHVASTFLISALIASLSALLSDSVELAIIVGAVAAGIGIWAFKGFGWLRYPWKDRVRDDS
jgi:hypothetical protein